MKTRSRSIRIELPPLSDEAAVVILEFLHEAVQCFEARYYTQIRRHYDERFRRNLRRHGSPPIDPDDVPF